MVVNFRTGKISQDTRKLTKTFILIIIIKKSIAESQEYSIYIFLCCSFFKPFFYINNHNYK
jgi:hypothetical protein